jgi:hypothetical protein
MRPRNFTREAEELFRRFANRHDLTFAVDTDPSIEVLWTFPAQTKLSMSITLGLQNNDELNFGVSDFWSYFFPFDKVVDTFDRILDAWVAGEARIGVIGWRGRVLQLREHDEWTTVYKANIWLPFLRRAPSRFVANGPV